MSRPVLLAAGGTGGHLFPAQALAAVLARRGVEVELITDARAQKYSGEFPARAMHMVTAATPTGGSPLSKAAALAKLGLGTISAYRLIRAMQLRAVVGFGGYPTVPPLLAASFLGLPTLLHEQNAVMGRANRFLAKRVSRIATGFATLGGVGDAVRAKAVTTGNPVRPNVLAAADAPYPEARDGELRLLVTGGSQGARVMSDIVPAAVEMLPAGEKARLRIVQQARGEDERRVRAAYERLDVAAEVAPFFADLPGRMARAHLVVARSGASTVSELAVIGRPAILVPFPFALDQDQAANAAELARAGAAEVVAQADFTAQWLAGALRRALGDPSGLANQARSAKKAGRPDAAERLADLVLDIAGPA